MARGTQACINASSTVSGIIGDLDTTIMFATTGTLNSDNKESFSDHRWRWWRWWWWWWLLWWWRWWWWWLLLLLSSMSMVMMMIFFVQRKHPQDSQSTGRGHKDSGVRSSLRSGDVGRSCAECRPDHHQARRLCQARGSLAGIGTAGSTGSRGHFLNDFLGGGCLGMATVLRMAWYFSRSGFGEFCSRDFLH